MTAGSHRGFHSSAAGAIAHRRFARQKSRSQLYAVRGTLYQVPPPTPVSAGHSVAEGPESLRCKRIANGRRVAGCARRSARPPRRAAPGSYASRSPRSPRSSSARAAPARSPGARRLRGQASPTCGGGRAAGSAGAATARHTGRTRARPARGGGGCPSILAKTSPWSS
jgi:hypothetical protein